MTGSESYSSVSNGNNRGSYKEYKTSVEKQKLQHHLSNSARNLGP